MNEYKLEIVDNDVVARVYIQGRKTSAYLTIIPEHLKSSADRMQEDEDNKPF